MIRSLEHPLSRRPSIVIMRGSLLPGGGILRQGGTGARMALPRPGEHLPLARGSARGDQARRGEARRGGRAARPGRARRAGTGDDLGRGVRARRRRPDRPGGGDHRGPALRPGEQGPGGGRGLARGRRRRPARASRQRRHDLARRGETRGEPRGGPGGTCKKKTQGRTFGAQDAPGYLGIYQRLVQPVHKGATLT